MKLRGQEAQRAWPVSGKELGELTAARELALR